MIKFIIGAIKALGAAKAWFDAINDDIDGDGKPQLEQIKAQAPVAWEQVKLLALLCWGLAVHIAKASGTTKIEKLEKKPE